MTICTFRGDYGHCVITTFTIMFPKTHPANTMGWPIVVSMLVQRRRQLANIETILDQPLVFAGDRQTQRLNVLK